MVVEARPPSPPILGVAFGSSEGGMREGGREMAKHKVLHWVFVARGDEEGDS